MSYHGFKKICPGTQKDLKKIPSDDRSKNRIDEVKINIVYVLKTDLKYLPSGYLK